MNSNTQKFSFSFFFLICSFFAVMANAQNAEIRGEIRAEDFDEALVGATVRLVLEADTSRQWQSITNINGNFAFAEMSVGTYTITVRYIGFKPLVNSITIAQGLNNIGVMRLETDEAQLDEVTVEALRARAIQRGDTTIYNADAFKTNPDASAEDLVTKMPGITVESGQVQAQGEDVRRVTVDGREFFGDDATLALRNLPAEVISQVQVFDQMSDQARFTGFDDGNTSKTLNIVTRPGMNVGQFGRIYAGYGLDDRYSAGGNINFFNGARRISVLGLSNNINMQNFSSEDLVGVETQAGGRGGRGGGRRGGRGGSGDAANFLTGDQGGINTTHSFGLNYSDNWGEKIKVSGSYFFNQTQNFTESLSERNYFLPDGTNPYYRDLNESNTRNQNHRFNGRLEYTIDSMNSIIWTPRISMQNRNTQSTMEAGNFAEDLTLMNTSISDQSGISEGLSLANNLLYRKRFLLPRRTLSASLNQSYSPRYSESFLYAKNNFDLMFPDSVEIRDQYSENLSLGSTYSGSLTYTEPIGKNSIIQMQYNPSVTFAEADRLTYLQDVNGEAYSTLDTFLSNRFDQISTTQKGGLSYRFNKQGFGLSIGADYQHVRFNNKQVFPTLRETNLPFNNILPNAMLSYRFESGSNLRLFYRSRTQIPSVNQLQDVIDNSNSLIYSGGNPDLKQSITHSTFLRYNVTNTEKARSFFMFLAGSLTNNAIGQSTMVATADTVLAEGIILYQGAQLNRPVNLDGNWSIRSFATYGMPVQFIRSNLNLNAGISFNRSPGLINESLNFSNTISYRGGLVLGSNISERLDFTLSHNSGYNLVENSLRPQLNNNYYSQQSSFRLNWMPWRGLVLNSDLVYLSYSGLSDGYNQDFTRWNAGIGYKFLKNNAAELRLNVFDILGQNNSISRTVADTYIEDVQTNALTRYVMLTFSYNLRQFSNRKAGPGNRATE
jgi:hypothetical protein